MKRLLIVLVIVFLASCSPLSRYGRLPEVKAWEPDIEKFEQLDISKSYPSDAIMFAGSSSIRLWSTIGADMRPYPVIQRGYGGAKLTDFAVYVPRIIYPHSCRAIVLYIGNDISGSADDKSPSQVASLFREVLLTIRKQFPKTPVFWVAITPAPARLHAWPEIEQANQMISKVCEGYYNTYFIPTQNEFLTSTGLPKKELFQEDSLHLNADGYRIWSQIIKRELDRVLTQ